MLTKTCGGSMVYRKSKITFFCIWVAPPVSHVCIYPPPAMFWHKLWQKILAQSMSLDCGTRCVNSCKCVWGWSTPTSQTPTTKTKPHEITNPTEFLSHFKKTFPIVTFPVCFPCDYPLIYPIWTQPARKGQRGMPLKGTPSTSPFEVPPTSPMDG